MRKWFLYIIIFLLLAGTVASWHWSETAREREQRIVREVRDAVMRLEREVRVRSATGQAAVNGRGWAETIDPEWFANDPPVNPLVPSNRPWLEVASEDEQSLTDPPIRQSVDRNTPAFWYNPATGRVRARVGPMVSDEAAIERYNAVNSTAVAVLFDTVGPEAMLASKSPDYQRLLEEPRQDERPRIVVRRHPFAPAGRVQAEKREAPLPVHATAEREPSELDPSGLVGPPAPDGSPDRTGIADAARPSESDSDQ